MPVTKNEFRKIALSFPDALEKISYGKPAFAVGKKFFTRFRAEDESIVLIVGSIDERDMMIESDPKTFHITDHYKDYPSVLVRIARIDAKTLHGMLERRWRAIAPKKLLKEIERADAPEKTSVKRRGEVARLAKKRERRQ